MTTTGKKITMQNILQLDRSGWTYPGPGLLRHATGIRLRVSPIGDEVRFLFMVEPGLADQILLHFPGEEMEMEMEMDDGATPHHDALWARIDACAGPDAQAAFARTYDLVQSLAVLAGVSGRIGLDRDGPNVWSVDGIKTDRVFGDHQNLVNTALARVRHACVPMVFHPKIRVGLWTHQGECSWDIHFTSHERLRLLERFQASQNPVHPE